MTSVLTAARWILAYLGFVAFALTVFYVITYRARKRHYRTWIGKPCEVCGSLIEADHTGRPRCYGCLPTSRKLTWRS